MISNILSKKSEKINEINEINLDNPIVGFMDKWKTGIKSLNKTFLLFSFFITYTTLFIPNLVMVIVCWSCFFCNLQIKTYTYLSLPFKKGTGQRGTYLSRNFECIPFIEQLYKSYYSWLKFFTPSSLKRRLIIAWNFLLTKYLGRSIKKVNVTLNCELG